MAVTKIIPIRFTIEKSIDYICNPQKTDDLRYIHSEHCVPRTAALEFQYYLNQTRVGGNTIGRHLIQSFAPGEVSPETAHEIGKRLAGEILGGQYAYVLATHVDRDHIHNHFVWCAANVQTHKKYRSNKRTYHEIRDASDRLCEEHNLSVIESNGAGKSYVEYHAAQQGISWKAKLKETIDTVLSESADFNDFLQRMESLGYAIKKGMYLSFRAPDQQRFTRTKTLGAAYTEEALKHRIAEDTKPIEQTTGIQSAPIQSIIEIESNEKIKNSSGYRQWAAIFNLKQTVAAYNLIQQYGGVDAFDTLYKQAVVEKLSLAQNLNGIDAELKVLSALRNNLRAYGRTKDVYKEYQAQPSERKKEKFYAANRADIETHRAAKNALSQVKKPVPNVKAITAEMERLKATRIEVNEKYKESGRQVKEMETIRKNLRSIIGEYRPKVQKEKIEMGEAKE